MDLSDSNYNLRRLNYNFGRLNYNLSDLNYNLSDLNYNLRRLNYNLSGPNSQLRDPNYNLSRPDYNLSRSDYNLSRPDYNLSRPDYNLSRPNSKLNDLGRLAGIRWCCQWNGLRRQVRESTGISLYELEARPGISKSFRSRLENSAAPYPTLRTLHRYAATIGMDLVHRPDPS